MYFNVALSTTEVESGSGKCQGNKRQRKGSEKTHHCLLHACLEKLPGAIEENPTSPNWDLNRVFETRSMNSNRYDTLRHLFKCGDPETFPMCVDLT
jgi:hypothetical protein